MYKRVLSLALALSLVLSILPPAVRAEAPWQCGQEEHLHEDACSKQEYTCGLESDGEHVHEDGCYEQQGVLLCTLPETHAHEEGCFDEESVLTCELPEAHTHGDGCYGQEQALICTNHIHTDACLGETVVCEKQEHTHSAACQCGCEILCTEDTAAECAVCTMDRAGCKGQAPQPVCDCDAVCAEGSIHDTCVVCTADWTACSAEIPAPVCDCSVKCAEEAIETDCPVCGAENAELSQCLGEAPAERCVHEEEPDACPVCQVEAAIEALPTAEDWLALPDSDQRLEAYNKAQTVADQYNALTEDQQGQVANFDKLMALHEAFNQQAEPIANSGICGDNLTWTLDDNGILTISGEGALTEFSVNGTVNAVVIEDGVTSIGEYAFRSSNMASITIPNSVTSIEKSAFLGCRNLTSVVLPAGITAIPEYAFKLCESLSSVVIPESVTVIKPNAFEECESLHRISLPQNLTTIGDYAFYRSGIREMTFPASVREIGSNALSESMLTSATFTGNAPSFGSTPFYHLPYHDLDVFYPANDDTWTTFIENEEAGVTLGTFVNWIKEGVDNTELSGTCGTNLTWVLHENGTLEISGTGDMDFFSNSSSLYDDVPWTEQRKNIKAVVVNAGVTSIGSEAFYDCINVTSVTLPTGITLIGDSAFGGCDSLPSISIPDTVTSIGAYAFDGCISLSAVAIPNRVTDLGKYAFYGCKKLSSATLSSNLTVLSADLFRNCSNLTGLVIPDGVTEIADSALGYTGLTTITIPASVSSIGDRAFEYCDALAEIIFTGDAPAIAEEAFYWTTSTVRYPSQNDTWEAGGVKDNYGGTLTWEASSSSTESSKCGDNLTWKIENGVLTISGSGEMYHYLQNNAYGESKAAPWYEQRSEITSVVIGDEVTSIGNYAFYGLPITSVSIGSSVTIINDNAFESCTSLASVTIPGNVKTVDTAAFKGCTSLSALSICEGVTKIWNSAFSRCTALASLTVPASVTHMGSYAFEGCSSLKKITFLGDCPTNPPVGNSSFAAPSNVFSSVTADGFYPAGNATWTEENWSVLGGTINWQASGADVCPHANLDEEWDTDYPMTYVSVSDTQHTVSGYANQYCLECFQDVGESYPLTETVDHIFNTNGDCTVCDYRRGCAHTATKDVLDGTTYKCISTTQHEKYDVYNKVCANTECNAVLEKWYRTDTATENHDGSGSCTLCGYGALQVTVKAGASKIHIGEEISAEAEITGGSGTYTIVWNVKKGADVVHTSEPTSVPTFRWTPDESGSYSIMAEISESFGTSTTQSSGAITVEDHSYQLLPAQITYEHSERIGYHNKISVNDKKCSVCGDTVAGLPVSLEEKHNDGDIAYEKAHPHKYYYSCEDCGYATYTGNNYKSNGVSQNASQCCVCNGHAWGESQYGSNIWYQTCAKCKSIRQVNAPVADTSNTGTQPGNQEDSSIIEFDAYEGDETDVDVKTIKQEIREWDEFHSLFDGACTDVLSNSESLIHQGAAAVYKATDIIGSITKLITDGVFGTDTETTLTDLMVSLIKENYMNSLARRTIAENEFVTNAMKRLKTVEGITGVDIPCTNGSVVKLTTGINYLDTVGEHANSITLVYNGLSIVCDTIESAQQAYVMQRDYEAAIEYLDNLRAAAPEGSYIHNACDIIQKELDDKWPLGQSAYQWSKNVVQATESALNWGVTTAAGALHVIGAADAATVSNAMIQGGMYLGDGTAATSVPAVTRQIQISQAGSKGILIEAGGVLLSWSVGNFLGKLATFESGRTIEDEEQLLLLYILNAETKTALNNVPSTEDRMAADVGSLYLTVQEAGLSTSTDYFIHYAKSLNNLSYLGGGLGNALMSFFLENNYPSQEEFEKWYVYQHDKIESLRSELGIDEGYHIDEKELLEMLDDLSYLFVSPGPGDTLDPETLKELQEAMNEE